MAVVEFPAYHLRVRLGCLHQLRFLQFARIRLHIRSSPPVTLDFGSVRFIDSSSVLDIHVFDGVQSASLVGVAFRYFICGGSSLVRIPDFAGDIAFLGQEDESVFCERAA